MGRECLNIKHTAVRLVMGLGYFASLPNITWNGAIEEYYSSMFSFVANASMQVGLNDKFEKRNDCPLSGKVEIT